MTHDDTIREIAVSVARIDERTARLPDLFKRVDALEIEAAERKSVTKTHVAIASVVGAALWELGMKLLG